MLFRIRQLALSLLVLFPLLATDSWTVANLYAQGRSEPVPMLAYYYIWFDENSWNRAKTDYPLLGHYSSDDRAVMREHIRWAKQAGIAGFIVSWKSTEKLDRRLAQLVEIAEKESFKLSIIYQGLDFEREPLDIGKIADDLALFAEQYGDNPVFDMFGRPLVIWSGTWRFSLREIAQVKATLRQPLLLLASERQPEDYARIAHLVDGNAYYWSSVDPSVDKKFADKLSAMAEVVHQFQGLWIAPVAPGFDARLIGGHRVVDRQEGNMLRTQFNAAQRASPDALGLISWNEFSENTHIEPSQLYGTRALEVLADMVAAPDPTMLDFDSSEPGETTLPPNFEANSNLLLLLGPAQRASLGFILTVLAIGFAVVIKRNLRRSISE